MEESSLAMELLKEVKTQTKSWMIAFFVVIGAWLFTIIGFIWYLNQFDYSSTIDQTGLYTYIDSDGNVISSDLSADEMESILGVIQNGKTESNEK